MSWEVSWKEYRWAAAVALVVVALSTIPYAAGYLAQTPDLRFAGAVFDLEDYHSHLAKMWQGYWGEWRYRLLFTSEEHEGAYLQTFYVALGHCARLLGLGLPLTYHLARVVAGVVLLLTVYRFVALFTAGEVRSVAFLLAATSSGLGWLVEGLCPTPPGGISPIDFWLIDAYTFFSLFTFPHFSAAVALLLSLYGMLLRLAEGVSPGSVPRLRDVVAVILLSWGLGLVHPYALLLADLVPALYLIWRTVVERRLPLRLLLALVAMGLAQAPLLLYDYRVFATSPVFGAWSAQNLTLSPPPLHYLLGYGVVALLAAWGVRSALRASRRVPFLLLWVVVAFSLAYFPWGLQRRFVEGLHAGLCVLAGYGLVEGLLPVLARPLGRLARLLHYSPRRLRWLARGLVLALAALSNLYLIATYTLAAAAWHPDLFHSADQVAAGEWLAANTEWQETVLAAYETGNWLAGTIGRRVVLGHWAETMDCEAKREQVAAFYSEGASEAERRGLLERWNVHYVYLGPEERALGGFDPAMTSYLKLVFQQGDASVYRVTLEGAP
ncbi:MAG: hypothetical protein ACE5OS_00445 [Anaerolineae bacterium]